MKTHTLTSLLTALAMIMLSACDTDPAAQQRSGLILSTAAMGACTDAGTGAQVQNGSAGFPAGANTIVVEITGEGLSAPITETFSQLNSQGQAVIPEIPPNTGLKVQVVTCTGEGRANWAGTSESFDLPEAGVEASVDIFLTPRDAYSRPGRCSDEDAAQPDPLYGHAHGALLTVGEQTWVFGGFSAMTSAGGSQKTLSAGAEVEVYDRVGSRFSSATPLMEARAGALVQDLGEGLVRLVGGVSDVRVGAQPNFLAEEGPRAGVEFYDTTGASSGVALAIPFAPMASTLALADGRALVVGGLGPAEGTYADHGWLIPAGVVTEEEVQAGRLQLPSQRYGAALAASGEGVLIWGGTTDDASAPGLWLTPETGEVRALAGGDGLANVMFGAAHHLDSTGATHRFVVLGGTGRDVILVDEAHASLLEVDAENAAVTLTPLDFGEHALQLQRAGASIVPLGDGSLWFLGGYQSFGSSPSGPCGAGGGVCLPHGTLNFSLGADGGVSVDPARSLSLPGEGAWDVGAFGVGTAKQSDGSWLVLPGFSRVGLEGQAAEVPSPHAALMRFEIEAETLCALEAGAEVTTAAEP